ncbi:MAG: hypothetical protein GTO05_08360 [Gemmatimonadales bacterium]|nr:hypothetical protein [Gemmatimonadales bacterium]
MVLWIVAAALMLGAAAFQRLTGPTVSVRGTFEVSGAAYRYRLPRSGWSYEDRRVTIPSPDPETHGALYYKRYRTDDSLTAVPLERDGHTLTASLPRQPAAGKLEYLVVLDGPDGPVGLPGDDATVVIRFKDDVPLVVLLPHVFFMFFMFFAVLFGLRAGLSALLQPATMPRHAWAALALMTVGGMMLGPVVQKLAFGAFWTGFPFGYDLTDNKTLLMWVVWVLACGLLLVRRVSEGQRRGAVLVATIVMTVVYLIPHSLRGSELDYRQLDRAAESAGGASLRP